MDAGKIWASAEGFPGAWRRQYGLQEFGGGSDITFGANGTLFAATGQWGWSLSVEGIVRSDDGGDTWAYACGAPNASGGQQKLAWSVYTVPSNTSSLWAVFAGARTRGDGASSSRVPSMQGGGEGYLRSPVPPPVALQTAASTSLVMAALAGVSFKGGQQQQSTLASRTLGCTSLSHPLWRSLNDTVYMITAAPASSSDPREALLFAAGQAGV